MIDPFEKPVMIELADGFFVRNQIDNTAWIDMGDFAIMIDTLEHAELEAQVFQQIEKTIGTLPINYVINTHTHYDHVALNQAFEKKYNSQIITYQTQKIPPEGFIIKGSKRSAKIYHTPGCHTQEDIIIWIPQDRVLFVGDIFGWGIIPLCVNMRQQQVETLLNTFQKMIDLNPAVVIPGHGPLAKKDDLQRWVEYLKWLIVEVSRLTEEGKKLEEIISILTIPDDMSDWWRLGLWKHEDNVKRTFKSVMRYSLKI